MVTLKRLEPWKHFITILWLVMMFTGCMKIPTANKNNHPPAAPLITAETLTVAPDTPLKLSFKGVDPDDDLLSYQVKIEDLEGSPGLSGYRKWTIFSRSGKILLNQFKFRGGLYNISLRCKDEWFAVSPLSIPLQVRFAYTPPGIYLNYPHGLPVDSLGTFIIEVDFTGDAGSMVRIDPGDGSGISEWFPAIFQHTYDSNSTYLYQHRYVEQGTYQMRAETKYQDQTTTGWSEPHEVVVVPGRAN